MCDYFRSLTTLFDLQGQIHDLTNVLTLGHFIQR